MDGISQAMGSIFVNRERHFADRKKYSVPPGSPAFPWCFTLPGTKGVHAAGRDMPFPASRKFQPQSSENSGAFRRWVKVAIS